MWEATWCDLRRRRELAEFFMRLGFAMGQMNVPRIMLRLWEEGRKEGRKSSRKLF